MPERGKGSAVDPLVSRMPGYAEAKMALSKLIEGKVVRCVLVDDGTVCDGRSRRKNQGRIVAQCFIGEIDIAEVMVRAGSHVIG